MDDLISRQAAINAVLGACKDTATTECAVRELEELPPAEPTQTKMPNALKALDCVERQAAIDAVNSHFGFSVEEEYGSAVQEVLNALPSVQPDLAQLLAYECGKASAQPEIVQCKKCKWYEGDVMANPWGVCCHDGWTSGNIGHEVSENGWCYRAERKTE